MFKVCKRCLQPCSLRQKKLCSNDRYFKIYSKKWTPLTLLRGELNSARPDSAFLKNAMIGISLYFTFI